MNNKKKNYALKFMTKSDYGNKCFRYEFLGRETENCALTLFLMGGADLPPPPIR